MAGLLAAEGGREEWLCRSGAACFIEGREKEREEWRVESGEGRGERGEWREERGEERRVE